MGDERAVAKRMSNPHDRSGENVSLERRDLGVNVTKHGASFITPAGEGNVP
jgi:hypothetical protein